MVALYGLTLFLSALLLFLVQPMVGKMVLPMLGGAPAVWNTCMVFFQAALLAGYGYAHLSRRLLPPRGQAVLHALLLTLPLALCALPPGIPAGAAPPGEGSPAWWLLLHLTAWAGLPIFVIATTAPLLQSWFADAGHERSADPYFLYAAGNAGSLLALIAFPVLVEPALTAQQQGRLWTAGYAALTVLIALCAMPLLRVRRPLTTPPACAEPDSPPAPLPRGSSARWIVLAFVPSSLMLGTTAHITTELAPVPFLWVAPLGLYLLSFVLVFARRPLFPHEWIVRALPFAAAPVAIMSLSHPVLGLWDIPAHLLALFLATMACHGALARCRPAPRHLTAYYLCLAIGGVLGGAFNSLAAPLLFNRVLEYPLMLVAACLVASRTPLAGTRWQRAFDVAAALLVAAYAVPLGRWVNQHSGELSEATVALLTVALPSIVCCLFLRRPIRLSLCLAAALAAALWVDEQTRGHVLFADRNFFGVKRIERAEADTGTAHYFYHGTITHGAQLRDPQRRHLPLTYYDRGGPMGELFEAYANDRTKDDYAVVGLATGTLAAYGRPGGSVTFYEIDPQVQRIAEDPALFTYLADCEAEVRVVLGDGRLGLARAPEGSYGLIIVDAFSSDAIPTHLLTVEAIRTYMSRLREGGVLVMHITNTYVELSGLLARIAQAEGLAALMREDYETETEPGEEERDVSQYMVLARSDADLAPLEEFAGWVHREPNAADPLWTDDFSNVWSVLSW